MSRYFCLKWHQNKLLHKKIRISCFCFRRHTSTHTACCVCCKPNESVETEATLQSLKGKQGSPISPYACSEIIPMTGYPHYENQCRVPDNGYVNTRDRPARYSSKIPSAIYDDIEGQVGNTYETHIIPNCAGSCEEQENANNEINGPNSHMKSDKTRKKSDDGYDSNSGSSIALQEGETLLIENDLYDSKSWFQWIWCRANRLNKSSQQEKLSHNCSDAIASFLQHELQTWCVTYCHRQHDDFQ